MEFDKSDHPFCSQHGCPCGTWLQSDEHVSGEERHRNNFLAIAPAMVLFKQREKCLDTFILQLRCRFPLEPVSSLDGIPWQGFKSLRSQIIGISVIASNKLPGKAPLVDSHPRFGRFSHSFAFIFGVRENTVLEARGLRYSLL